MRENSHWGLPNLNGWTFEYEMLFYLVVAAALECVHARHATVFATLTLALLCASVAAVDHLAPPTSAISASLSCWSSVVVSWRTACCKPAS